jgi:hypothetical protein
MLKIPLSKSNPYLREAADLKAVLLNSIATSTAIEGVHGVLPKSYKPSRKKNDASIARERAASYRSRR